MVADIVLQRELFKIRLNEPLYSEADNIKALPIPKGIYKGLVPTKVGNTIKLGVGTDNMNLAVIHTVNNFSITFHSIDEYTLDFTGHTQYPAWIVLEANYTTSADTTGRIFVTTVAPSLELVKICKVLNSNLDFDISIDSRDFGLIAGVDVKDVSNIVSAGSDPRYARVDHVHKGVRSVQAGTNISIDALGNGDYRINATVTPTSSVPKVIISGKYLASPKPKGTPLTLTWDGSNSGFTLAKADSNLIVRPCIGVLVTDNPSTGSTVDVLVNGEADITSAVFNTTITNGDVGKAFYVASVDGKLTISNSVNPMQRVGVIKQVGASIICIINPSLDVFSF